jgi:molybdenum cofactor cytidylyltransferase
MSPPGEAQRPEEGGNAAPAREPAAVVVLAAGKSSRMGQPKGLQVFAGRPWIEVQLAALGARRVVVVLGHDHPRYREAVPALDGGSAPAGGDARVEVVVNHDPDRGPFSSLQVGLAAVAGAPAFVLPVDVPAASARVWEALEAALSPDSDAAVPLFEGRGGHPVLLAARFIAVLRARPADDPALRLDRELAAARLTRVPVLDPRVRMNLNAPGDWEKWTGQS